MLCVLVLAICAPLVALQAQPPSHPAADWRSVLQGVPAQPRADTRVQDIERLRWALREGSTAMLSSDPADYEANRDLIRRVVAYLAAMEVMARDPALRMSIGRAYRDIGDLAGSARGGNLWDREQAVSTYRRSALLFGGLSRRRNSERQLESEMEVLGTRMAMLGIPFSLTNQQYPDSAQASPESSAAAPAASEAPFPLMPPSVAKVPAADKAQLEELREAYLNTASKAATAWQNAETIRLNLAARGMSLNAELAGSLARMQLYLQLAVSDLESRTWADARQNIERADYQTEKVFKSVGR